MANEDIAASLPYLDARTFQSQLGLLANTVALKLHREGAHHLPQPAFVVADIYYLLRQSFQTYNFLFFINADNRRKKDCDYRIAYSAVSLPLVRTMIDCLYNITAILDNPGTKGREFRESGLRQMLETLDVNSQRYGGDPKAAEAIAQSRARLDLEMRLHGFVEAKVRSANYWPTLSQYLRRSGSSLTPHQEFLKSLTLGLWREYSAISHASFQGLLPIANFLAPNDLPHEQRGMMDDATERLVGVHIPRVAAILLSTITEIQVYFKFEGARINQRLHEVWNPLLLATEVKELYDKRYAQLMKDAAINP